MSPRRASGPRRCPPPAPGCSRRRSCSAGSSRGRSPPRLRAARSAPRACGRARTARPTEPPRRPGTPAPPWPRTPAPRARRPARRTASRRPDDPSRRRSWPPPARRCPASSRAPPAAPRPAPRSRSPPRSAAPPGPAPRLPRPRPDPRSATVAIVSPVAGFSTGIPVFVSSLGRRPRHRTGELSGSSGNGASDGVCRTPLRRAREDSGVRTIVVSDLHLGSGGDIDLLRRPELREVLWAEVQGADEVVLLGDALELRDRPLAEALELARPFFDELGSAIGDGDLIVVPGNHDHHLLDAWLERRRLEEAGPLRLEERVPADSGPLARLTAGMGRSRIELAYPGAWLRPGVYATHGHYLDRHLTVPTFERLAVAAVERVLGGPREVSEEPGSPGDAGSASIEDYERIQAPVYAFLFTLAQAGSAGRAARGRQPLGPGLAGGRGRLRPRREASRLAPGHGRPARGGGRRQPARPGAGQIRPLPRRDHERGPGRDRRGDAPPGHRRRPPDLRPHAPQGPDARGERLAAARGHSPVEHRQLGLRPGAARPARPRTAPTGRGPSPSSKTTARPSCAICSTTAAARSYAAREPGRRCSPGRLGYRATDQRPRTGRLVGKRGEAKGSLR